VKLYEKLLPFAVLWGVETEWNKELAIYYEQNSASPDWFVGTNEFNASLFSGALAGLSAAIITSSTPPAPPRPGREAAAAARLADRWAADSPVAVAVAVADRYAIRSAASTTFCRSIARVIGPTPPGLGER
jgi:hypothetical protein